jgi:hypothetical protein
VDPVHRIPVDLAFLIEPLEQLAEARVPLAGGGAGTFGQNIFQESPDRVSVDLIDCER